MHTLGTYRVIGSSFRFFRCHPTDQAEKSVLFPKTGLEGNAMAGYLLLMSAYACDLSNIMTHRAAHAASYWPLEPSLHAYKPVY